MFQGFGATGTFWAHSHWNLSSPPDMVTFSKKAQTAGYFFGMEALVPDKPYRQFNTWMGDPARVLCSGAVIKEILDRDLISQCRKVGTQLYSGLQGIATKYPELMRNLRGEGMGTFIAFDTADAGRFMRVMQSMGVIVGTCGVETVRFRPMLVFGNDLVPRVLNAVEQSCELVSKA
jgi:4-aminobutyrate aminotransferase / (S)-3-amino-2-methylpropionate transaminase